MGQETRREKVLISHCSWQGAMSQEMQVASESGDSAQYTASEKLRALVL